MESKKDNSNKTGNLTKGKGKNTRCYLKFSR
jgi:hypothetical protein